jgi:molecular chaperone DnaK
MQGERDVASGNRTLGKFVLDGIPPAPRGMPQIEVTFDIDANGILSVHAKDKASDKEQSIRIEGSGGLSQEEIDRMMVDAEQHAVEDAARKESVEKHNALDGLIYQGDKQLSENGDKLSDAERSSMETALADARKELESDDPAKLDVARQKLEQELHKLAEALYKAQTANDGAAPGSDAPPAGDEPEDAEVVDAEYTEEKRED